MKITLKISPLFFITAGLIGFLNSFSLPGTLIWVAIILGSVLFHELGHAMGILAFGGQAHIELVAFGGLTSRKGLDDLKGWREFIVVLLGPLFGLALAGCAFLVLQLPFGTPFIRGLIQMVGVVNLFWTAMNMLPILPLDGGHLMRIVLSSFWGARGWKISFGVSLFAASLIAVAFFVMGLFIIGSFFLLFAFQSADSFKQFNDYSEADQDEETQRHLKVLQRKVHEGVDRGLEEELTSFIAETGKGVLFHEATELLGRFYYTHGKVREAYEVLSAMEKTLSMEGKSILYAVAYEVGDFKRAAALSSACFQERQTADVALIAAAAYANLKESKKSIAWLETLRSFSGVDIREVLKDKAFDKVRADALFKDFLPPRSEK